MWLYYVIDILIGIAIGFTIGYFLRKSLAEAKINTAEEAAKKILEEANREAEAKKREAILEAKEEIHRMRSEADRENKERRNELAWKEDYCKRKKPLIENGFHRTERGITKQERTRNRKSPA